MNIAVFHNLPSGGAKRALYGLIKYLRKMGCSVDVFVPSTAEERFLPLSEVANKLVVIPVRRTLWGSTRSLLTGIPPVKFSLIDLEKSHKEIAGRYINRGKYDVVLVEQDRYTFSPFILRYLDKPNVYYCQQPMGAVGAILQKAWEKLEHNPVKRWWRRYLNWYMARIDKINAMSAGYIVTNSYFSRESILRTYGLNALVSYLGVDREVFNAYGTERERIAISVGAVGPRKGHDFIIRALSLVDKSLRPRLVVVGDQVWRGYAEYLRKLAQVGEVELDIRSLIDDRELVDLYNKAKVFVYAPYLEPFGLGPIEAMACGTPVIAVKEGGVRESIIDGYTGFLVERDEQQFAEAVQRLLENSKHWRVVSENCVNTVKSYWTMEKAAERLLRHLERAREGRRSTTVRIWRE